MLAVFSGTIAWLATVSPGSYLSVLTIGRSAVQLYAVR